MRRPFALSLALFALAACNANKKEEKPAPAVPAPAPPATPPAPALVAHEPAATGEPGIALDHIDKSVKPGDDFFRYANGAWLSKTEIPADRSTYGAGAILSELTTKRVSDLIQDAVKNPTPATQQVADFYTAFMDENGIETKGLAPLQPTLDKIAAINDAKALAGYLGSTLRADVDVFNNTSLDTPNVLGLWVAADLDEPTRYTAYLLQGGLLLPDREYYLDNSPRMSEIRTKYEAFVTKLLELAKLPEPAAAAKRVIALEKVIAQGHAPRNDTTEVKKGNNHWSRADLDRRAPGLDWAAFLDSAGLANQKQFVAWQPSGLAGFAAAVKTTPLSTWKEYLQVHALAHAAAVLPKDFAAANFGFFGTTLAGVPQQRERWRRAVDTTGAVLGDAVGKLYVTKYFPESEKKRAQVMVKNVMAAFEKRIDSLPWMSAATKQKAKAKLAILRVGVGFPDRWRDYAGLTIKPDDALGNFARAELFEYKRNVARLGQAVDRDEWVMVPHIVNAVNLPALNAMNFPAGMLQPPYFDPRRPEVMDYGAFGSVIGHEISHSFDDQGALFDVSGKLSNWWTPADFKQFTAVGDKLVKQYDAYQPFPDLRVDGRLTLGENIADVAGLAAAYDAYRMAYEGKEAPAWKELSGDQQFFIAFAQGWQTKYREPTLRRRIMTDGHAPAEYRADTVRNLDPWYAAFKVGANDKLALAPADRVRIW